MGHLTSAAWAKLETFGFKSEVLQGASEFSPEKLKRLPVGLRAGYGTSDQGSTLSGAGSRAEGEDGLAAVQIPADLERVP